MTTPMAISKCFKFTKNISLRSLIHLHPNPIPTVDSTQVVSQSQLKLRRFEPLNAKSLVQNDVAAAFRNQISLAALQGGGMVARGRAVKIDDEFEEEDFGDESDEFESEEEDEDEFDEMDGEDCLDDDDDDEFEDPVYKKRK